MQQSSSGKIVVLEVDFYFLILFRCTSINPEIVSACGEDTDEEGCLSIPGVYAKVKRPQSVVVRGLDRSGQDLTIQAQGLMAHAFAHEIDHLDGILFIDRIGMVKRGLLRKKLAEIRKQAKEMISSRQ